VPTNQSIRVFGMVANQSNRNHVC